MDCVKDTDLHIADTLGPGRPVVLIHGWPLPGELSFDQKGMARWPPPSLSRGSTHNAHPVAWIASRDETPCLSALGWAFTQGTVRARPGSPLTCSCGS